MLTTVITGLYRTTFFLFELLRGIEQVRDICLYITLRLRREH